MSNVGLMEIMNSSDFDKKNTLKMLAIMGELDMASVDINIADILIKGT